MQKKLNEKQILDELSGSVFFRGSKSPAQPLIKESEKKLHNPKPANEKKVERQNDESNVRTNERSNAKRVNIRHTFDIYKDQLMALHTLQLRAVQSNNNKPKLGDMVKEAIDMFLESKHHNNKRSFEPTNERDSEQI